jgi:hypothetical protein
VWCRNFAEEAMLPAYEKLLDTVPFSRSCAGFTWLVIRAVGPEEAPLVERDLRAFPATAGELVEMAREHLNEDCSYEAQAAWDLWLYDLNQGRWQQQPQQLELICSGQAYDGGSAAVTGHFLLGIGLEHYFTGHGNLLGARSGPVAAPQHPLEAEFLNRMARPERLAEYHEKTRENIAKLFDWMRKIEAALPVERYRLWSEGEENFEARLDEILALR